MTEMVDFKKESIIESLWIEWVQLHESNEYLWEIQIASFNKWLE